MSSYIQNLKKIFCSYHFFLFFLFFLTSCSQNVVELNNATYSIIYDYKDSKSTPNSRLSFFLESSINSDIRRIEQIIVYSEETGYIWDFNDLIKYGKDDFHFVGATNLVPPENEIIPSGTYVITYISADDKSDELKLTIKYDKDYYGLLESEAIKKIKKDKGMCKIAIYDENNVMIYYGEKTDQMKTKRDIWNNFMNAKFYQDVWIINKQNVICILPLQEIIPEK